MLWGSLRRFKCMHCVDFAEIALFFSFWHHLLTTTAFTMLSDKFLIDRMNNRDSKCFFSRRLVCRSSDSSYNSTGSSLIIANWQQRWHGTRGAVAYYYVIAWNVHSCGYSVSVVHPVYWELIVKARQQLKANDPKPGEWSIQQNPHNTYVWNAIIKEPYNTSLETYKQGI